MKFSKWQLIGNFLKDHTWALIATILTGLIYNVFIIIIPIAIGKFYELNFNISSKKLKLLESFDVLGNNGFSQFLYLFIGLIFIRFIFEYLNRYLIGFMGERFSKELREKLFEHQLHVTYQIYEEKGIGKYLLRFSGDLKGVQNYLTRGLLRFSQDVVLIIILLVLIAFISPMFALAICAFGIVSGFLLSYINIKLFNISAERRDRRSGLLSFVNTRLRAILSIKTYNKYTPEIKRYNKRSENIYKIGLKYQHIISLIYSLVPAITYLLIALLMALVFYYLHSDSSVLESSELLILILIIISFLPVIRRILRISVVWKLGNISFTKLIRIFDLERENLVVNEDKNELLADLNFKNISYTYPNASTPVFEELNLSLSAGNIYHLLGVPGSGKTTLLKLLLSIYKPTSGIIEYGNLVSGNSNELDIRRQIAVVSSIMPLYGKDVYEAVVYSRNEERKLRAEKLLIELQQHEPDSLRLKLEDKIGELGSNLTAGQQKILMYVRALLTNKPILILENPFTDLSEQTVKLFRQKINLLLKKRLIIMLSNEPIGKVADMHVFQIQDGQILEHDAS